jgi:hypothetical protein
MKKVVSTNKCICLYSPTPSACSNIAIGIPTFFDLPQTTACFPNVSTPMEQKQNYKLKHTVLNLLDCTRLIRGKKSLCRWEWKEVTQNIVPLTFMNSLISYKHSLSDRDMHQLK